MPPREHTHSACTPSAHAVPTWQNCCALRPHQHPPQPLLCLVGVLHSLADRPCQQRLQRVLSNRLQWEVGWREKVQV